jgi:knotted carbamoyltransferase YgeW
LKKKEYTTMDNDKIKAHINQLEQLDCQDMYLNDFLLTWEKSDDEVQATFLVAEILRGLRQKNISSRIFDSGLGISLFRDQSTRTRFSFASACNLLGLEVQDLDEGKSQVAAYMREVSEAVEQGFQEGVLEQRPTLVNLQCDIDHPTQSMSDMLHLINTFGGMQNLAGMKIAMTWAYSPSYGKPLSVPQGIIGLMTRFGMEVVLAHPKGYEVMPAAEEVAQGNADRGGGSFIKTNSMAEAFEGAHIVYPKSWAPFAAMEKRTDLYGKGDDEGINALEKELLAQNAKHKDWECTEKLMELTHEASALYMHCLPADITGVSCTEGEVQASVFDRYRVPMYMEASYKPYIIAAMILLSKVKTPADNLINLLSSGAQRIRD